MGWNKNQDDRKARSVEKKTTPVLVSEPCPYLASLSVHRFASLKMWQTSTYQDLPNSSSMALRSDELECSPTSSFWMSFRAHRESISMTTFLKPRFQAIRKPPIWTPHNSTNDRAIPQISMKRCHKVDTRVTEDTITTTTSRRDVWEYKTISICLWKPVLTLSTLTLLVH